MKVLILNILFFTIFFFQLHAKANCPESHKVKGSYIVKLQSHSLVSLQAHSEQDDLFDQIRQHAQLKVIHNQVTARAQTLSLSAKMDVPSSLLHIESEDQDFIDSLMQDERIESLEQDCYRFLSAVPNDSRYSQMFHHQVMNSEAGWDIQTGTDVVVAVVDDGVDYNHEDLRDNMWTNDAELNGQAGVDDDGNGQVDDIYGYDFADRDGDPMPTGIHGTHVAGTVAAKGNNNTGVVGVVWDAKIMAVKGFGDNAQGGRDSDLLNGLYYAVDNGARVINGSFGGPTRSGVDRNYSDLVDYAIQRGVVPVFAAGNDTVDARNFVPANVPRALTVGASNSRDELATFSNFGSIVDVIAPGGDRRSQGLGIEENILSSFPNNLYEAIRGTSMASPQVAGLATLILSEDPNLSAEEVMDVIRDTGDLVDVRAANSSRSQFTYPRINVGRALASVQVSQPPPSGGGGNPGDTGGSIELPSCNEGEPCAASGTAAGSQLAEFGGCGMSSKGQSQASTGNLFLLLLILQMPLTSLFYLRKRNKNN